MLRAYLVPAAPDLTGDYLEDARMAFDRQQRAIVNFTFNPEGGRQFAEFSLDGDGALRPLFPCPNQYACRHANWSLAPKGEELLVVSKDRARLHYVDLESGAVRNSSAPAPPGHSARAPTRPAPTAEPRPDRPVRLDRLDGRHPGFRLQRSLIDDGGARELLGGPNVHFSIM